MPLEENLQVFRFCRIPFGVVSSPFLLGATIVHHLKKSDNLFLWHLVYYVTRMWIMCGEGF